MNNDTAEKIYVSDILEQKEPGTYRQKVAYSEAVDIKKALTERKFVPNVFDKWNLKATDGSYATYCMGSGEFVITLKTLQP